MEQSRWTEEKPAMAGLSAPASLADTPVGNAQTLWRYMLHQLLEAVATTAAILGLVYEVAATQIKEVNMGVSFNPERDIGSLEGKVVLVTGGNAGLGKQTIAYLAAHNPAKIYLAARTASKAESAIKDIRAEVPNACDIEHLQLDLTSFSSIADAAATFTKQESRLDLLINNAGIMACPYSTTKEGYEIQFGTNHMGHALLTKLLLPTLLATADQPGADVRIINLSSEGHNLAPSPGQLFDAAALEQQSPWGRYGNSKLSNVLFARELADRHPQVTSVSLHPGVIFTDLYVHLQTNIFMRAGLWIASFFTPLLPGFYGSSKGGALNSAWCATTSKENLVNGAYYKPVGVESAGSKFSRDKGLQKKLAEFTDAELAKHGY